MKTNTHPKWFKDATVKCACGNDFTMGLTVDTLKVDVCSNCHPFYTGTMKFLDTAGRVDSFRARQAGAKATPVSKAQKRAIKKEKRIAEEFARPTSLEQIRGKVS